MREQGRHRCAEPRCVTQVVFGSLPSFVIHRATVNISPRPPFPLTYPGGCDAPAIRRQRQIQYIDFALRGRWSQRRQLFASYYLRLSALPLRPFSIAQVSARFAMTSKKRSISAFAAINRSSRSESIRSDRPPVPMVTLVATPAGFLISPEARASTIPRECRWPHLSVSRFALRIMRSSPRATLSFNSLSPAAKVSGDFGLKRPITSRGRAATCNARVTRVGE